MFLVWDESNEDKNKTDVECACLLLFCNLTIYFVVQPLLCFSRFPIFFLFSLLLLLLFVLLIDFLVLVPFSYFYFSVFSFSCVYFLCGSCYFSVYLLLV